MSFLTYFLAINTLAFAIFAYDKHCAKWGKWRVPEKTLHTISAAGGSLAALAAIFMLRHKNRKMGFMITLFATIIAQFIGLVVWVEKG
jgi:uncharacterized membrane protein YsdA (DUF1294 family)